ncbi:tyrosine-type recombinase/integrase [Paraburkholderia caballeronis]|uniref:tyrosine-type recombinase/integrase n=1 Tax=Paraburkholderia caballeronis TaxID=416943 RepID=UPI001FB96F3D|nr:tyrosine-type recombinase/integrase [Paraburkholderia caballeronis]
MAHIPTFVKAQFRGIEAGESTRAALLFAILTSARSGEVRGATWDEFDLDASIWTVHGELTKAKEPHRVPLSLPALIKRLKEQKQHENLVFPSPRSKVLSDMTLTALLRRVKAKSDTPERVATAHGFRSSFRDWGQRTGLCARPVRAGVSSHCREQG